MALTNGAVTVDTTAGGIKIWDPSGSQRNGLRVTNTDTTLTLYLGASGLTTSTGSPVLPGVSVWLDDLQDAIYGIVASSSVNVRYLGWGKAIR